MAMKLDADEVALVVSALRMVARQRRADLLFCGHDNQVAEFRRQADALERVAARMEGQTVSVGCEALTAEEVAAKSLPPVPEPVHQPEVQP